MSAGGTVRAMVYIAKQKSDSINKTNELAMGKLGSRTTPHLGQFPTRQK